MGIEENKNTIRRLFEEVFKNNNLELIPELVSPNLVVHVTPEYKGHEGLRQHQLEARRYFSNMHITLNHMFAEGDMVGWSVTLEGTHTGELAGIAPTGKNFSSTAIMISRMENGKEAERWQGLKQGEPSIFQQLGIIPPLEDAIQAYRDSH